MAESNDIRQRLTRSAAVAPELLEAAHAYRAAKGPPIAPRWELFANSVTRDIQVAHDRAGEEGHRRLQLVRGGDGRWPPTCRYS